MQTAAKQQVFAIYSRKSKFTGKGESIENQIEMCRQYISRSFGQEQAMMPWSTRTKDFLAAVRSVPTSSG